MLTIVKYKDRKQVHAWAGIESLAEAQEIAEKDYLLPINWKSDRRWRTVTCTSRRLTYNVEYVIRRY